MSELHPRFADAIAELQRARPELQIGGSERHGLVHNEYRFTAEWPDGSMVVGEWCDTVHEADGKMRGLLVGAKG